MLPSVRISRYDPTKTTALRNAFSREMSQRFVAFVRALRDRVVGEDDLGLGEENSRLPTPFSGPSDRVSTFLTWVERQADATILETRRFGLAYAEVSWMDRFVRSAYERGVLRARQELRRSGYAVPPLRGIVDVAAVLNNSFHSDQISLLYVRTYNELKGITAAMVQYVGRTTAQSVTERLSPRQTAVALVASIVGASPSSINTLALPPKRRAEILAKTEIIRAHHAATIAEYRSWGADRVRVKAEWVTAGDDRVCGDCEALEGQTFDLDMMEGMIPLHPLCRCVAIPLRKGE